MESRKFHRLRTRDNGKIKGLQQDHFGPPCKERAPSLKLW